ncbi:hypothetical protein [Pontibacter mangrovi]|uniref:Uncharacterized protein n=1 Tax=Pontibacter mangrovi TaxID=2589816 RepID=A0A501VWX4_9BACT|nr:hypothetical protein [Pontibacter mangrovi]TPE40284.1 hypothetical protein FJM65_20300 [Pontibacter mangrovi]
MYKLQEIFSNRELALIAWTLVATISILFDQSIRKALYKVLRAFFQPSILIIILLAMLYSVGVVYILRMIDLWSQTLLKNTLLWFFGSGVIILFSLNKAEKEKNFFTKLLLDNLKLLLVFEFIINLHQFSLTTELVMLPVLAFLTGMKLIAEREERTQKVKVGIEWILTIGGLAIIVISLIDIYSHINDFANPSTLTTFLLPIILSISFIPCAYFIALYMGYEMLYVRLTLFLKDKQDLQFAKWRVLWKCNFHLSKLKQLSPKINVLNSRSTRQEIKEIIN